MPKKNKWGGLSFAPHEHAQAVKHIADCDRNNQAILDRGHKTMRNEIQGMASYYHKQVFSGGYVFGKSGWNPTMESNPKSAWADIEKARESQPKSKTGKSIYQNGVWVDA